MRRTALEHAVTVAIAIENRDGGIGDRVAFKIFATAVHFATHGIAWSGGWTVCVIRELWNNHSSVDNCDRGGRGTGSYN